LQRCAKIRISFLLLQHFYATFKKKLRSLQKKNPAVN